MKNTTVFIISGDENSKTLAAMFLQDIARDKYFLVEDHSMSLKKIWNLIKKRRIGFIWLLKQVFASYKQKQFLKGNYSNIAIIKPDATIRKHSEFLEFIESNSDINTIFAFRAGIILQKSLISKLRCINTHYASLPSYGGLGSIQKALDDKAYQQNATIHEMETTIDSGKILLTQPYELNPKLPYWQNELKAALAGVDAAKNFVTKFLIT